jgi:putative endonuclease
MFYVYFLKSHVGEHCYFGFSSDLKKRLEQHNQGKSAYTKRFMPWELVYYEAYSREDLARDRERQLKRFAKSYAMLKRRLGL